MFNKYNLNTNANLGFFKHSNDDYNFINKKKLSQHNPYIGYFSQYKNSELFGLSPEDSSEEVPYKKGNPNIITRDCIKPMKNKTINHKQTQFTTLNRILFGDSVFLPMIDFQRQNSETRTVLINSCSSEESLGNSVEINDYSSDELLSDIKTVDLMNFGSSRFGSMNFENNEQLKSIFISLSEASMINQFTDSDSDLEVNYSDETISSETENEYIFV